MLEILITALTVQLIVEFMWPYGQSDSTPAIQPAPRLDEAQRNTLHR